MSDISISVSFSIPFAALTIIILSEREWASSFITPLATCEGTTKTRTPASFTASFMIDVTIILSDSLCPGR